MTGSRISGIISGMDVDSLVKAALQPKKQAMQEIQNKMTYDSIKKETLQNEVDNLQKLKDITFKLKMESTFKNKVLTSSDESIVKGTATVSAVKGNYSVKVDQLAVPARTQSTYARASLLNSPPNTMGLSSISGRPLSNLEGEMELTVSDTGSGGPYKADTSFTRSGGGQMAKISGSVIESTTTAGTIANTIQTDSNNNELQMTVNGKSFTINLDFSVKDKTSLKTVAADLQTKINDKLNTLNDTTDKTYIVVKSETVSGTGNEKLDFYNLDSSDTSSITFDGGNAKTLLGLGTTTSTTVTQITDSFQAGTLANLRTKLNDSTTGFIPGVTISPETDSEIKVGTAKFNINSELRTLGKVYPRIEGDDDISTATSIDLTQKITDVPFTKGAITYGSDKTAKFTINGVQVTIPDITTATVNDVLSIINSAGTGVTASYDSTNDRFVLNGNDGSVESTIHLGDNTDNTNLLNILGLSIVNGGTLYPGSSTTTIDTTAVLSDAGFSETPTDGTFTINGVSLYVNTATDSLDDIINKINSSNAKVIASYDMNADKFILKSDPEKVDTNSTKITLGSSLDTSNLIQVLNLSNTKSTLTGTAQTGNRGIDKVSFSEGSVSETVTIPATTGSGAYNATPLTTAWTDGIANGATFSIAVNDGSGSAVTGSPFTWTAPTDIYNLDDFISAWNDSANWKDSGGAASTVQVGVLKEGDNSLRFFNLQQGASNDFTISEGTAGDAAELGITSGATISNGASATADAEYNALNFSYSMMTNANVASKVSITTNNAGGITITSKERGNSGLFLLTDETTQTLSTVNDYFGDVALKSNPETKVGNSGQDAQIEVDGVYYTRTSNKVDDVIGGVELNLMSTNNTTVTISIENDTDKAVDQIAKFILQYNKLLKEFDPPSISKSQRKYLKPLTEDMLKNFKTASEIDDYQEKYKKYTQYKVLREENSISTMRSFLRTTISTPAKNSDPKYQTLMSLGIEAGSLGGYEDAKKGYLIKGYDPKKQTEEQYLTEIKEYLKDNTTFMDALKNDEGKVYQFFAKDSDTDSEDGLAVRLTSKIDDYILTGGILKDKVKINGSIDRDLRTLSQQYENYKKRFDLAEKTLYSKYTAMEETMARLQQQSSTLSQKFGTESN